MTIMMAARPFLLLSTDPIIAWTVNGVSTPTTEAIIPVKGDDAVLAVDLIVRIMCAVPGLLIIAPYVIASFMVGIVNVIMWSASNVNRSKLVSSVRPNTRSSLTDVTSAGTPNAPCVRNGCPSRTTSVTFNPWWNTRSPNQQRRGEVAWWRHPLPCLFTRILKPCKMRKECLANLSCYSSSEETTIHVLDGEDCALQFLRDLDDLTVIPDREGEREILVVFHNLKGFDGMFILHELYQQQREVVDQLTVGAKVLSFKSGPVKFIDSLCFLPMPLASFPSTFNLTELKKGFFPYLFNTPDHQQYVGRMPDLEFYDPDGMMAKKKDELTRWHADQVRRNVPFHFRQEMIEYCKSDVALLKAGCEAFQQEFERQAGFNPMAKCITIASACNLYWRKHHLTPDTIAVEPLGGWRGAQVNQSLKALQWLYYQEHQIPKQGARADRIRHVRNGGEQSIRTIANSYFVDGYDPLTRTVYEFHGCLYHGCPSCYPNRPAKHYAVPDRSVEELYQATLSKRMALLRAGYTVIEIWECEWDKLVDTDEAVQRFLNSFDLPPPLEPREAFFGGRTGAVALHAVAGEGEEIIKIHEVWHFPPSNDKQVFSPITSTPG